MAKPAIPPTGVSRSLEHLHPIARTRALAFLAASQEDPWLRANGIDVLVTCTYRTPQAQALLYAQGRSAEELRRVGINVPPRPGRIVTRALPGRSEHNHVDANGNPAALALDFVPLRAGKPVWGADGDGVDENPADDQTDDLETWQRCGALGIAAGFSWYGTPGSPFREMPHLCIRLPT